MKNKTIWIVGAGTIGLGLAQTLSEQNDVHVFTRQKIRASNFSIHHLASYSSDTIGASLNTLELPNLIIVTTGILHDDNHAPEKTITQIDKMWLDRNVDENVLPTLYLAQRITEKLKRSSALYMVAFSARVGSIEDNCLGGWHSYRMSKAMLNMLIKNIAIEWRFKSPDSAIIGYHPGTVDSRLSKPFQENMPAEQLFTPKKAISHCLEVIETITPAVSGQILDWQGKRIPY